MCLFLIGVILLQQGKGGDIANAFGGGGSQAVFGARSGATLLTRATSVLAALFVVLSMVLTAWGQRGSGSVVGGDRRTGAASAPAALPRPTPAPATTPPAGTAAPAAQPATPPADGAAGTTTPPPAGGSAAAGAKEAIAPRPDQRRPGPCQVIPVVTKMRKWRNWQTHQLEGLAFARTWGFESPLPHQILNQPGNLGFFFSFNRRWLTKS